MAISTDDVFVKQYLDFLKKRTKSKLISEDITRLTTPLLDKNNDAIEVYIRKISDEYIITDDGYIINDLETSGVTFEKNTTRYQYLRTIMQNHGISLGDHNSLIVYAKGDDISTKLHMLTQAMVKISDMNYISRKNVQSLFIEDVRLFFESNDIRYTENISFIGKSKLSNQYDFVIPGFKKNPERIVSLTRNLDTNFTKMAIFSWEDIKDERPKDSVLYVMYDDRQKKEGKDTRKALSNYGIKVVDWTNRDLYRAELSA